MARKTAFIKVSGDLLTRDDVLAWLKWLVEAEHYFAVICIGGGKQIMKHSRQKAILLISDLLAGRQELLMNANLPAIFLKETRRKFRICLPNTGSKQQ